eukprot:12954532-Alexandrium_andersonii.AAC.1
MSKQTGTGRGAGHASGKWGHEFAVVVNGQRVAQRVMGIRAWNKTWRMDPRVETATDRAGHTVKGHAREMGNGER